MRIGSWEEARIAASRCTSPGLMTPRCFEAVSILAGWIMIQSLEESAESLRERCLKFYKGSRKYTEQLGEGYDGDIAFASLLKCLVGGTMIPSVLLWSSSRPVMTNFTIALREIGTYKEVLRSQVEHMLNDRLLQFVDIDLHEVKVNLIVL
ncbi:putative AH/BAR domain superfamily protein [Dioscorea sansibarensis]